MSYNTVQEQKSDFLEYNRKIYEKPSTSSFSGHSHNFYEIIFVKKGDVTYVAEDRSYKLKPGDLIITRPLCYHFVKIDSEAVYDRHNIIFDHKGLGVEIKDLNDSLDVINVSDGSIIADVFEKMELYCATLDKEHFIKLAKILLQEIIYNLSYTESVVAVNHTANNTILSRALTYISENLFAIKSIAEVSSAVFVTESYLYRIFKKELNKSPKKYLTEKRLLVAETMIKKGKKPTDASVACGFDDYTGFYRNYLQYFGRTPSQDLRRK